MKKYSTEKLSHLQKMAYQIPVPADTFRVGLYAPPGSVVGGNLLHIPAGK